MKQIILPNRILFPQVEKLISEGLTVTLRVKGNSMLPFIQGERDNVELQKATTLRRRSIVLARLAEGQYVIHRIVELSGDDVVLMGDGNLCGREHCKRADVIAEVMRIQHNGKTRSCFCRSERMKVNIWMRLLPFRRYLLAIYRRLR